MFISYAFGSAFILLLIFPPLVLLSPAVAVIAYLDYKSIRYELRNEGVFIRRGFFIPRENFFLYRNIQDVEDVQSIIDRVLGTHALIVKTMTGTSAIHAVLPYISAEDATKAREYVLKQSRRTSSQVSKVTAEGGAPLSKGIPTETLEVPFTTNFFRAAKYAAAIYAALIISAGAFLGLIILIVSGSSSSLLIVIVAILTAALVILVVIITLVGALIQNMSYSYALAHDAASISINFLSSMKRQIPYDKIQDIEKRISFPNSFANLADITLETGSKEYMGKEGTVSMTRTNETVPALYGADVWRFRQLVVQRMGVSLSGLGENPLVHRIPLSVRKPLKKTLWWVIYAAILLFILLIARIFIHSGVFDRLIFLAVLVTIPAIAVKYFYEREYLKKYFYDINDDVLVIRKGVFGSREITIPFTKMQEVFVNRDILDLIFGLYDVYVSTATSRSILNAHIDGLDEKNAEDAAILLVKHIAASK